MDFVLSPEKAYDVLKSLGYLVVGVTAYAIFVFNFYRLLARKDIIRLDLRVKSEAKYPFVVKLYRMSIHLIKYLTWLPAMSVFWFAVLVVILSFLAKSRSVDIVLQIAVTIVAATRVTSYYNEDLARDLAKMLPFALLGIFLVDPTYVSVGVSVETFQNIFERAETVIYYLLAVIGLEYGLRIADTILRFVSKIARRMSGNVPVNAPATGPNSE